MVERSGQIVRHAQHVAGEIGRRVIARVLDVLFHAAAHVLRFRAGIEHVLHRGFEVALELGERILDRRFVARFIRIVTQMVGHAFHFA